MKKKWFSLATVLCLGLGMVSGCKNNDGSFKKLNLDGHDIVLMLGDNTKYTADDLFGDMLMSELGAKTAYEKILKMLVENTIETDANMEASWELLKESFDEKVLTKVSSEGISKSEARKALLAEEGYSSMDEKKEAYLYGVKLAKLQEEYWKAKKNDYYSEYFNERLPYYVKHVLVKTGYTANRAPYSSVIDSDDAKDLYDVYSLLVKGEKFSYIMNHKSEDTGSADGSGYHMDLTTSFVTEFLHGVFTLDSLMKNKTDEVYGLNSDVLNYYVNGLVSGENDYNFNVIYASDIEMLGNKSASSDYNSISTYEKDEEGNDVSVGSLSNSNAYGSTSALYTRTIIFNRTFNNPGISVIAYDLDEELPTGNYIELTINGKKQKLLTDENGNLVFIACAKGSSNDYWVHFLTVDVSPFDANAKLFYSIDEESTIKEMVAAKKAELELDQTLTDTDINSRLEVYEKELKDFQTYVDIKGGETQSGKNKIIEELEGYVKSYAKRGITSGAVAGEEQFLTYDMVKYYMDKGNIIIKDQIVKTLVESYIENQKALIDLKAVNSIANGWAEYYDRVAVANSEDIEIKKIPMECSYGVNNGAVCKYYYDEENEGFEIMITYKNVGDANAYMPTDTTKYTSSFRIGDGVIELPDEADGMHRDGYTFEGWYSTSTFDEGTEVTQIDASRSSTKNKVVVYAKWTQVGGGN